MDFKNIFTLFCTLLSLLTLSSNASEGTYDIKFESLTGKKIDFKQYKGKILLVVNKASNVTPFDKKLLPKLEKALKRE